MLRRWVSLFVVLGIVGFVAVSLSEPFSEHVVRYEPPGLYAAQGDPDANLQQQFAVDQGTFSGDFATCGTNTFSVSAGTQTIDVVASATVPANDIKLSLVSPAGVEVANVDTGTSPEAIHYSSSSIAAGTWTIKVCPASSGQTNIPPTTYSGAWATQDVVGGTPNPPVVGGTDPTAPSAGTPTPTYAAGELKFAPETVVDPQRTEGEPVNFFAKDGSYWESGPFGTSSQQSWVHKSTDGGLEFHETSPLGLRPDGPPGGGDTDVVVDDQGFAYFSDLEGLAQVSTAVSNDGGNTWKKNALSSQEVGVDRQWYAMDNGTTPGPADNTVFFSYRQVPLGPQILSSPGSTGQTDATGGLVWTNAATGAGALTVSNGAPCGHLIFDPVKRNLYMPCGQGDHLEVVYGHVAAGQRTNIDFKKAELPASPAHGDPSMVFPWMAADDAGNLMAVWVDGNDHNVYESVSKDGAQTWTTPLKINTGDAKTNEFPEVTGRGAGEFVIAWYGNANGGSSDDMPANTSAASGKYPWFGYVADVTHADTLQPTVAQQKFTEHPMHYGMVCNQGTTCTSGRTLADYFDVGIDQKGAIRLVFDDESSQYRQAHLMEVRQLLTGPEPKQPMADPTGDAQMPHFSPGTGPGSNLPQADFTNVALSQPAKGVLRVQMTVAGGLANPTPPPGKPQLVWLTRFQAKSLMPASDGGTSEAYRIFYVGARSTEGGALTYFAGSGDDPTGCLDTSSGCKIVFYPAEQTLTSGSASGNTITVDVSLQNGFGSNRPIDGDTLYSVTALSYGQNGDADIYLEGDATHSFDYSLGNAPPASVPQPTAKPSGGGGGSGGGGSQRIDNGVKNTKTTRSSHSVRGRGLVAAGRLGTATFTIGATSLVYVDRKHHVVLRAPVGTVRFGTIAARISGYARVNGKRMRFAAVAVDHGKKGDIFRIAWNGGPSHGGRVRKGGIAVT